MTGKVYLIPAPLTEGILAAIPGEVLRAVQDCHVFFVETERGARRYLKSLWREMIIDDHEWIVMDKQNPAAPAILEAFKEKLRSGKNVGIVSDAGCPGIADPGQHLVAAAHVIGAAVKPLTGPSSLLLALMASGMNGQHFRFTGYVPIDRHERIAALKQLENHSASTRETQVFIETPYRNNQLLDAILKSCRSTTKICIAVDLGSENEMVRTKTVAEWKMDIPELHKRPAIFCLTA